jgi:large subunit ribosomal protein L35
MPKLKTKRAAAKRFKKTATGKIKRRRNFHTHILTKKTPKRKRNLRKPALISPADLAQALRMIPN